MKTHTLLDSWPEATMILFSSIDEDALPTLKQACRELEVEEARYYVGHGPLRPVLRELTEVQTILKERAAVSTGAPALNCAHLLVTQGHAKPNMFFALRHSKSLMGGFELDQNCLSKLTNAIRFFRYSEVMKDRPSRINDAVLRDQECIAAQQCSDSAVEQLNLAAISNLMHGYGEAAYAEALQRLKDWFHAHRWNLVSGNGSDDQRYVDAPPADIAPSHA